MNQRLTLPAACALLLLAWMPLAAQDQAQPADDVAAADNAEQQESSNEQNRRLRRLGDSLSVDPTREWSPTRNTGDRTAELARKLTLGERALVAGDLVVPPNANALEFFREALEIEPDNLQAQTGVTEVVDALLRRARTAFQDGDRTGALRDIDRVRGIDPVHPGIDLFNSEVLRTSEIAALLEQAGGQMAQSQFNDPPGDNALETFQAVLAMDPANVQATEALGQIEAALLARATTAVGQRDFALAFGFLDQAEQVRGGSDSISVAREEANAMQELAWNDDMRQIVAMIDAEQLDQAEQGIAALLDSGYSGSVDDLRGRLSEVRLLLSYEPLSTFRDPMRNGSVGPSVVVVPRGDFMMGSPEDERGRTASEGPRKPIRIGRPFGLGQTEVTVGEFRAFVTATGYQTDAERSGESTIYDLSAGTLTAQRDVDWRNAYQGEDAEDDLPVIHVSWNDANAYVLWLSEQTGQTYRLPTESEFEYALRAGTETPYWWGDGTPRDKVENLTGSRDRASAWQWPDPFKRYSDGHWGPSPVASFESNPYGIFDIGGNAMEWVEDCYTRRLADVPDDGAAHLAGSCRFRTLKGGSWATPPSLSRSAYRASAEPTRATCLIGFRIARDL
ncbi:MAG: SUMF1/EgtB/PvdO family nonheme iron enzyme [Xanthomonadales bacterium]|nr:SUMF1/EgtB/PvdO family nonheme iron enzyme [Xanthomonadales bacterium]